MGNSRRGPGVGEGPPSAASDGRILRCVATLLHPSAASAACDTERGGYSCSAREPLLPFLLLLLGHGRERGRTRRAPAGLAEEELASGRHGRLGAARYVSAPVCLFFQRRAPPFHVRASSLLLGAHLAPIRLLKWTVFHLRHQQGGVKECAREEINAFQTADV